MKTKHMSIFKIWTLIFLAFTLQNCAVSDVTSNSLIQKRKFTNGFHIPKLKRSKVGNEIAQSNQAIKTIEKDKSSKFDWVKSGIIQGELGENSSEKILQETNSQKAIKNISKKSDYFEVECDQVILRNGDEISAKVIEVGSNEIRYKLCDNLDGPVFVKPVKEIFMIKYPNGTKTVFEDAKSEKTENVEQASEQNEELDESDYIRTINTDDKSFIVAVALWFFLGLLGIHRFYLGHYGIGILYLLTAGLCGFGWLIDGILFITGDLKPKKGKYIDV